VSGKVSSQDPGSRALQNFFAAVKNEDSLFSVESPGSGPIRETEGAGEAFCGEVLITFRSEEDRGNASLHFTLVEKLTALLKEAGSAASLAATLCLVKVRPKGAKRSGLEVWLQLEATGDSAEQAEMRWGLGLAHVQQALLFTSRMLRQQGSLRAE
jgi:hypothetical protein